MLRRPRGGWRPRPGSSPHWCTTTSPAWTTCSSRYCATRPKTTWRRQREAIAEAQPLHALWQLNNAHDAQLFTEFLAMANHRTAIRSEIVAYAMRFRDLEEGVVTLALKARGVDLDLFPPVVMSMIMGGLARIVLHEHGLGITRGHDQATAFIERCLERFEMPAWDQQPADRGSSVTQHAQATRR